MKLHYMGKYNLDPETLPTNTQIPNAIKFKEPEDTNKLAIIANSIAFGTLVLLFIPLCMIKGFDVFKVMFWPALVSCLLLFPHELIHAICFKKDVYLYTNLKQGMLFVVGPEDMSKFRFVFMSLLPTIILGIVPYVLFFFNTDCIFLGLLGAFNIASGGGDFINVFNSLTQMPKGARTYLYKFNSYWYIPENTK